MANERPEVEALVLQAYRRSRFTFDLAISAFLQALHSHRRPSVCTPFPTSLFATEQAEKDFGAAEDAIREFSNLYVDSSMIGSEYALEAAKCENPLSNLSFKSLKLVQWLLRLRYEVHMVGDPALELPKKVAEKLFGSPKSALALSGVLPDYILKLEESDAKACTAFEHQRSRFGSVFAFHGTSAENLHSILRCGLLILSNSSLQRNGAIFGEGIYLSSDPAVALGFSKAGVGWECSHFGQRARYLLLCEVALGEQVLSSNTSRVSSSKLNGNDLGKIMHAELSTSELILAAELLSADWMQPTIFHPLSCLSSNTTTPSFRSVMATKWRAEICSPPTPDCDGKAIARLSQ
ncbi:hypothetical protein GOP47_0018659 [Adiantum capillus-veneris]|uniref:Poly [ADP-ribose] polymerase n=1 Tax=Adiantum capillus-veneris TaxID=13818 RepID=A0A9D4UDU2_ADICA|nr:hypothetical protein GOP47_0018659 [Adiantum capillus-veneris]